MNILSYKLLSEAISDKTIRSMVSANRERGVGIKKIASVNRYRGLNFSFIKKSDEQNFLRDYKSVNQYSNIYQNFAVIYEGNSCYLYPYVNQEMVLADIKELKSYIKLDLFFRNNQAETVDEYFRNFTNVRNRQNEFNLKNFEITIGPMFDAINKKYNIKTNNIKFFTTNGINPDYFINFKFVTQENVINVKYNEKQTFYNIDIEFTPYPNTPTNLIRTINSFSTEFDGNNRHTFVEYSTSRLVNRVTFPTNNFLTTHPYFTFFTRFNGTKSFYIYTPNKFNDYFNQLGVEHDCYIGENNNQFIHCKLKVVAI